MQPYLIAHFVKLCDEKNGVINDEQTHLAQGLEKLWASESQVLELQRPPMLQQRDLEVKDVEVNSKLQGKMLEGQQAAEVSGKRMFELQGVLEHGVPEQEGATISAGWQAAQTQLDQVGPLVAEAKRDAAAPRRWRRRAFSSMARRSTLRW